MEIKCNHCGNHFEAVYDEDGECPECKTFYFWILDQESDSLYPQFCDSIKLSDEQTDNFKEHLIEEINKIVLK
jgi:hypothetical protein